MLLLLLVVGEVAGFSITKHNPADTIVVKQGEPFTLMVTVDGWYEWCTFRRGDRVCDYEWKRSVWNVTEVPSTTSGCRAAFQGVYDDRQCGITIAEAKPEDAGEWSCDLEEYNRGGNRGEGAKVAHTFTVVVEVPTTTTTTTTTTTATTTTTPTTTTTISTEPPVSSTTEEYVYEETEMDKEKKEDPEDYQEVPGVQEAAAHSEDMEVKGTEDEVEQESMLPVGLAIFFILVIISAAAFGLHYKRKLPPSFYSVFTRKWKPVLPHEEFPVTEEEEEKNHPSIIKNGAKPVDLNVSELGPMGDAANINPDLTTVSFIHDEKVEDLKKDIGEDTTDVIKDEEVVAKDAQEEETKDDEKKDEEKEVSSETTPLTDQETK